MIATLPPYKPQRPLGMLHASVAITLILSPALLKIGLEQRKRQTLEGEFESKRSQIFSRIDLAVDRQDLETLTRINRKYAGSVSDNNFQTAIREAMAKVTAHEAQLELIVSRHLDLLRHQEETPPVYDPKKPQLSAEKKVEEQPLSKLPR